MAHDNEHGWIRIEDGCPRIRWPGAGRQPIFKTINTALEEATTALGGVFVKNPIWSKLLGKQLVTVHPLGGCSMAEDAETGVLDHKGRVFASQEGKQIHDGLYVADGAILPMSLGVNPLLTISALAERCCALIAKDSSLTIDYAFKAQSKRPCRFLGLQFTERMCGHFVARDISHASISSAAAAQSGVDSDHRV